MLIVLIERQVIRRVRISRLKHLKCLKINQRYKIGKVRIDLVCAERCRRGIAGRFHVVDLYDGDIKFGDIEGDC